MKVRSTTAAGSIGPRASAWPPDRGFSQRRILPSTQHRMIGPFILLDQFGPDRTDARADFDPPPEYDGAIAVLTFLFDGEVLLPDDLGGARTLRQGEVSQLAAAAGNVTSSRLLSRPGQVASELFGVEAWIALADAVESVGTLHFGTTEIPRICAAGVEFTLIAGASNGLISPVAASPDLVYAEIVLTSGAKYQIKPEHRERAIYVVGGEVEFEGRVGSFGEAALVRLDPGREYVVKAPAFHSARVMLLGGDPLPGSPDCPAARDR